MKCGLERRKGDGKLQSEVFVHYVQWAVEMNLKSRGSRNHLYMATPWHPVARKKV